MSKANKYIIQLFAFALNIFLKRAIYIYKNNLQIHIHWAFSLEERYCLEGWESNHQGLNPYTILTSGDLQQVAEPWSESPGLGKGDATAAVLDDGSRRLKELIPCAVFGTERVAEWIPSKFRCCYKATLKTSRKAPSLMHNVITVVVGQLLLL